MKQTVGFFFIIQSFLTYLVMDTFYNPYKIVDKPLVTGPNAVVVSFSNGWPGWKYVIPSIIFVLGIYFILGSRKEKNTKIIIKVFKTISFKDYSLFIIRFMLANFIYDKRRQKIEKMILYGHCFQI